MAVEGKRLRKIMGMYNKSNECLLTVEMYKTHSHTGLLWYAKAIFGMSMYTWSGGNNSSYL